MRGRLLPSLTLVLGCALAPLAAWSASFVGFLGLGSLPGGFERSSFAWGISADGRVIVGESSSQLRPVCCEVFRWTVEDGMVGLGTEMAGVEVHSEGRVAVSPEGSVVVGRNLRPGDAGTTILEAYRWTSSTGMVGLGDLPGGPFSSQAGGVSAEGAVVVGGSVVGGGINAEPILEAFRWTASQGMVGIGDLPSGEFTSFAYDVSADGTVIVGMGTSVLGSEAFRWTAVGGMVALGRGTAYGVSADGSVVVGGGAGGAFRWTSATGRVRIGSGIAWDTSADGAVVVGVSLEDEAFVWDTESGQRPLRSVLEIELGQDLTGWTLLEATAVSGDGRTVVGIGINPSGETEGWIAFIPEPATGVLVGTGLLGLAWRRRRSSGG